jgi:hypothetical protein
MSEKSSIWNSKLIIYGANCLISVVAAKFFYTTFFHNFIIAFLIFWALWAAQIWILESRTFGCFFAVLYATIGGGILGHFANIAANRVIYGTFETHIYDNFIGYLIMGLCIYSGIALGFQYWAKFTNRGLMLWIYDTKLNHNKEIQRIVKEYHV